MSECPGNPEGHNWILHKENECIAYPRKTYRTFFKKRLTEDTGIYAGRLTIQAHTKKWYCSACREWDIQVFPVEGNQDEDWLAKGYTIHGKMPTLSTREQALLHGIRGERPRLRGMRY